MDVQELLLEQDLHFVPRGADYLIKCVNPEHEDNNPSMRVDSVTGIFGCFSCGFKGNIFTHFGEQGNFLQIRRDLFKRKIQAKRAESIGLQMPTGYIPYEYDYRDIKASTYVKFNAFSHHDSEFIGRLVIPITDISGKIVAFQGRHLSNGDPRYNIVPAKAKVPLFPIVEPRRGAIMLVEGIFDMLNLHDKGITNSVCIFGTNTINETKLGILAMQGAQSIDVFMDGDVAGQRAAEKIAIMCENVNLISRNIYLEDKDPGELNQKQVDALSRKLYG